MYERIVVHAIQHTDQKSFDLRYRPYPSAEQRDRTFELITKGQKEEVVNQLCRVTLTITAETVAEQQSLDLWRNESHG